MKWNWRTYLCQMHLGRQFLMLFVYIVLRIESLMDVCPSCFTEFFIHFTTKSSIHNRQMTKMQRKIGFYTISSGFCLYWENVRNSPLFAGKRTPTAIFIKLGVTWQAPVSECHILRSCSSEQCTNAHNTTTVSHLQ